MAAVMGGDPLDGIRPRRDRRSSAGSPDPRPDPPSEADGDTTSASIGSASLPRVTPVLPELPPFILRARLVSPLSNGRTLHEVDGVVAVDGEGRIAWVGPAAGWTGEGRPVDLRPWALLPGMVDLHAHLPQLPNAGVGFALDLLTWLDRLTFPTERSWADPTVPERLAPAIYRAFARAGTTTVLAYGVVYEAAMDVAFAAAEAHGIRAILGKVMMDRLTYDPTIEPATILERSLRESADLISRWHGRDTGRLGYAVTPRFAVSCTAEMLRESALLARATGTWWQTHVSEDRGEIAEVRRVFPDALDYVDVYDRAGGLGERTVLAHAIHLSEREVVRLAETGTRIAHCPASNLFVASGLMPLARWLEAGLSVGLGSDVSGGPDPSLFTVMRVGAYAQNAWRVVQDDPRPILDPLGWLRMATLEGARALGLDGAIGSIETGKEADLIVVDPSLTAPLRGVEGADPEGFAEDPSILMSRLIFRAHPDMVRGAWVRGRRLDGPEELRRE
jgi:guanine deaminase